MWNNRERINCERENTKSRLITVINMYKISREKKKAQYSNPEIQKKNYGKRVKIYVIKSFLITLRSPQK